MPAGLGPIGGEGCEAEAGEGIAYHLVRRYNG